MGTMDRFNRFVELELLDMSECESITEEELDEHAILLAEFADICEYCHGLGEIGQVGGPDCPHCAGAGYTYNDHYRACMKEVQ